MGPFPHPVPPFYTSHFGSPDTSSYEKGVVNYSISTSGGESSPTVMENHGPETLYQFHHGIHKISTESFARFALDLLV
jgi:V8-like Glu-specific endopeptidase